MGEIRHEALVFETSDTDYMQRGGLSYAQFVEHIDAFRANLPDDFGRLFVGPVKAIVNGYVWFIVMPDGSKEGWAESNRGDRLREHFAKLCASRAGRTLHITWGDEPAQVREA